MSDELTLQSPVIRALASAALMPDLRSILLIDASHDQVMHTAALLKQLLEGVVGNSVQTDILAATETDDMLWGMPFLPVQAGRVPFVWRGLLAGGRNRQVGQLVVIPNLAQLSLAVERALVMTVGADVLHLERHGQQDRWRSRVCWLAACAKADIGKASPHILDRFALRIDRFSGLPLSSDKDEAWLFDHICSPNRFDGGKIVTAPAELTANLLPAVNLQPSFSAQAAERVIAYQPQSSFYGARRDLALGRLAVTQAMLAGDSDVLPAHVDLAAEVIGLERLSAPDVDGTSPRTEEERQSEEQNPQPPPSNEPMPLPTSVQPGIATVPQQVPVYEPDSNVALPSTQLPVESRTPYPEDSAVPEREAGSLRLPMRHDSSRRGPRGPAVGVERAHDLHDLAIAASVFEAAKYWAIRRTHGSHNDKWLIVRPSDLRQYRRLPVPETLLVLVIDYTALRKCAWEDALITHLEWAYTSRAGIALIRVGAKDSPHELRAEQILGRSLLAPQIDLALEAESGRATPLAHGLELASQTLRHAMLHGRAAMSKARLVVLTDGRGNVPLAASYAGKVVTPVNREGIDDALAVAAQIRSVSSLEIVFLDPQPSQHSELPLAFANALGVEPTPVPRHQSSHTPVGHRAQETQV